MLVIRMQRVGRKKLPQYRVVVQDSRSHPSSGKVIERLGSYDPHSKVASLKKDEIEKFLSNGAQPSERVVKLLQANKIDLPSWVKLPTFNKARPTRNPDKLRKNQVAETEDATPSVEEAKAEKAEESVADTTSDDAKSSEE